MELTIQRERQEKEMWLRREAEETAREEQIRLVVEKLCDSRSFPRYDELRKSCCLCQHFSQSFWENWDNMEIQKYAHYDLHGYSFTVFVVSKKEINKSHEVDGTVCTCCTSKSCRHVIAARKSSRS
ncbi:hypothetical protein RRG08_052045 [Elysia crispata]|uniref:SWIM-type domain-containing protein n=1 Tax=Elysia crispata TaxID=231223 RepID=A0AAE1DS98_9GAST|nr:hypothetical protein RRG08_052045 [Elysia crispata]